MKKKERKFCLVNGALLHAFSHNNSHHHSRLDSNSMRAIFPSSTFK